MIRAAKKCEGTVVDVFDALGPIPKLRQPQAYCSQSVLEVWLLAAPKVVASVEVVFQHVVSKGTDSTVLDRAEKLFGIIVFPCMLLEFVQSRERSGNAFASVNRARQGYVFAVHIALMSFELVLSWESSLAAVIKARESLLSAFNSS